MAIDNNVWAVIITSAGASVTTLFIQIFQFIREGRIHRWQTEQAKLDRRLVAENMKEQVVEKIRQNTVMNKDALDAANSVNEKILAIGELRQKGSTSERT